MCDRCGSDRILTLSGKTSDLCSAAFGEDIDGAGYVPRIPNIGEHGFGDYIEMDICMECGQVQGNWPVSDAVVIKSIRNM